MQDCPPPKIEAAPRITIQEVLAEIRSATDRTKPFRLTVVISTNRSRGDIRILHQCIKGAAAGYIPNSDGEANGARILHKERDTIPITDLEDGQYKTIPISHIIGYNQYKVYH